MPLILGAPGIAFPRIDNIGFIRLLPSLILVLLGGIAERGVRIEWTVYPLLSVRIAHAGTRTILSFHLAVLFSVLGTVNLLTSVINIRSTGIIIDQMALLFIKYSLLRFYFY